MITAFVSDRIMLRGPLILFWSCCEFRLLCGQGTGGRVGIGIIDASRLLGLTLCLFFWTTVTITGYAILISPVSAGVHYFAIFLTVAGVSPCIALAIAYVGANFGPLYRRATVMGVYCPLGSKLIEVAALLLTKPLAANTWALCFLLTCPAGFFFTIGNSAGLVSSNIYPTKESPRFIKGHAINLGFAALTFITTSLLMYVNWRDNKARDAISKAHMDGRDVDPTRFDSEAEKQRWGYEGYTRDQLMRLGDSVRASGPTRADCLFCVIVQLMPACFDLPSLFPPSAQRFPLCHLMLLIFIVFSAADTCISILPVVYPYFPLHLD